jgi:YgiT-type zinc finger domain-containing protein
MKCVICKEGQTKEGQTSLTLEREGLLFVIRHVPAQVCSNCGEAYLDVHVTQVVLEMANKASQEGIQFEVCQYKVA